VVRGAEPVRATIVAEVSRAQQRRTDVDRERYANRAESLGAIAAAALTLVDQRLLLPDDVPDVIRRAASHDESATAAK
jgi:hypothetical protein